MKKHFAALDGLRGISAFVVVILHACAPFEIKPFPSAPLAVDFFFALSGFVVAFAYEDRLIAGNMTVAGFLRARVERLHPLIVMGVLFGATVYVTSYALSGNGSLLDVAVAIMFGLLLIPFTGLAPENPSSHPLDPPSWSLFAEYLANLVYALVCRRLTNTVLVSALAAAVFAESALIGYKGSLEAGSSYHDWPIGCLRVVFPFLAGIALHRLWKRSALENIKAPFFILAIALLGIFALPSGFLAHATAVFIVFPLIIAAGTHEIPSEWLRSIAMSAGKLSYPLYIVHYPFVWIFSALGKTLGGSGFALGGLITAEIVTMTIAAVIASRFYDDPLRARLAQRKKPLDWQAPSAD